jgi:carbon-monoxide dehydrogenase medium subunit
MRWQAYHRPATVEEALSLLHQYAGKAQVVAGGTDLILEVQQGTHAAPAALVDVTAIRGFDAVAVEGGTVVVGAAVTHAAIESSPLIRQHGTALAESCSVVGGPQVRNVATLGGNVAHALPAADGTIGLLALDAEVQVCSWVDGEVSSVWQPLLTIFAGPGKNRLAPHQLLGAFRFSVCPAHSGSAFDRPQGVALPILGVAARVTLDDTGVRARAATIAVGPAGPIPFRATESEAVLLAAPKLGPPAIEAAVAAAQQQAELRTSKHRASKEYRHELIAVLLRRVLTAAIERARVC